MKIIRPMYAYLLLFSIILNSSCQDSNSVQPPTMQLENDKCDQLFPPADTVIATHTDFTMKNYPARIKLFQIDTIDEGDIVMLGNSLTEQGGNWNVKLGTTNTKNRGIAGDNTDGVLARLNELLCRKPSAVFLMIGTNDLWLSYSAEKIVANIDLIGSTLATELPESVIVVQTIMPLASGNSSKQKILAINQQLNQIENSPYKLLDTFQHMANSAGDLPEEYTFDGVHLTPAGYDRWAELLKANL